MSDYSLTDLHTDRQGRLENALALLGCDQVLIAHPPNIRYLTGFTGTTAILFLGSSRGIWVDGRYEAQAADEVSTIPRHMAQSSQTLWAEALRWIDKTGLGRIAVEGEFLSAANYHALPSGQQWAPTNGLVAALRRRKDAYEIEMIRRAVTIAEAGLAEVTKEIRPGWTEHRLAGEIELRQRSHGGERSASEIIVASGARSSRPHGLASSKVIVAGDVIMLDVGTVVGGYLSDITRTISVGTPSAHVREVYDTVREAQAKSMDAIRPGVPASDVDRVARGHIEAKGYGQYFSHGLGHSIGLENHEAPRLSPFDDSLLEPGHVMTVEPGVYLPGEFGIRIEDMILVTASGYERMTTGSTEMVVI